MPSKEKPYRVYRAGRARGPIKPLPRLERQRPPRGRGGDGRPPGAPPQPLETPEPQPGPRPRPRRRRRWWIYGLIVILLLVLLVVAWGLAGYFSLRSGVHQANDRLPASAGRVLADADGSILSSATTTLLLGADRGPGRKGIGRADAIVLVRTDPDHHRISLLSIPRDLRVEIPGRGPDKINAAYAYGGASLTIRTVEHLTGIPVNHVAIVDFSTFDDLIDAIGGVTVDVPERIVSNRFDCPYKTQARCERWKGWQFKKGKQTMDGQRALVYSRIRENTLDPNDNDLTRGGHQQQVVQAIAGKLASFGGFLHLPFWGEDVARPLATDLSTNALLELGWVKFRSSSTLECRLGGTPAYVDGIAYLTGSEENVSVVSMFEGKSAPQRPSPGGGPFAPGCTVKN